MLLQEIVEFATDNRKSISVLLRKCLILAHKLRNERLATWANSELSGYQAEQQLPDYRIVQAHALGYLAGPFGAAVKNMPIPATLLRPQHRHFATQAQLRQPISAYEDMASSSSSTFVIKWPADFVMLYQDTIVTENGCQLVDAWQPIGKSAIVQLIDAVRNRTLAMALDLQHTIGDGDEELVDSAGSKSDRVEQSVINNIYGGTNIVSFGNSHVAATVNEQTLTIARGDRESLDRALRNSGLTQVELDQLSGAIEADGNKGMGDNVRSWMCTAAAKVLTGGIQVGTQVGTVILTELLKRYFGLN